jgi:hypothetical protein
MNPPSTPLTDTAPSDRDLAEQANPGQGVPSQDPARSGTQSFTAAGMILMALLTSSCQDSAAPSSKVLASPAATASQVLPLSFVGTLPDDPKNDIATNSTGAQSTISRSQQSKDMPMPGQANDHSTLAPNASQKAKAKSSAP